MRNRMDYNQACTGLVDTYVGSAFETIQVVANNIELFETLRGMDVDALLRILAMAPDIQRLLDGLQHFEDRYYGALATEPTTRPSGGPCENGDLFYNTTLDALYIKVPVGWVPATGVDNIIEVIQVQTSHFKPNNDIVINLQNSYNPGTNNLMVFVNATFQYSISASTPNGAYAEVDPNTIKFPGGVLREGDIVTCIVGKIITNVARTVGVTVGSYRTTMDGERVIKLPDGMYYDPGINNLEVYVDGALRLPVIDYSETDRNTISFYHGLPQGSLVAMKKGAVVSTGTPSGIGNTATIRVLNLIAEIYHLPLDTNIPLLVKGHNVIGDGGAGIFLYEPLYDRADANGGTVIDPGRTLNEQGQGTGNGCWVRQYDGKLNPAWFGVGDDLLVKHIVQFSKAKHGDVVDLKGFHTLGDGGEGTFYWDKNCGQNMHDGGTIISPQQPWPPAWGAAADMKAWYEPIYFGSGCWRRMFKDRANLHWFGAKGDGVSDDTWPLKAALDSISMKNIDDLEIPVGNFVIKSPAQAEVKLRNKSFRIFGHSLESNIHLMTGGHTSPISFNNCIGVEISNLQVQDDRNTGSTAVLEFLDSADIDINQCTFTKGDGTAVLIRDDATGSLPARACDNVVINRNHFARCVQAIVANPLVKSRSLFIENNMFDDCGDNGPCIQGAVGYIGAVIRANHFQNSKDSAIQVSAYESVIIDSNEIDNFEKDAIEINASGLSTYPVPGVVQALCINNHISVGVVSSGVNKFGVYIHGDQDAGYIDVSNNTVLHVGGIKLDPEYQLKNVVISRNKIQDAPDYEAILLDKMNGSGSSGAYLADNYIENENVARTTALMSLNSANNAIVKGNVFRRSGSKDIIIHDSNGLQIIDNVFNEPNVINDLNSAVIWIDDKVPNCRYTISSNEMIKGRLGKAQGLLFTTTSDPQVFLSDNRLDDANDILVRSLNTSVISDENSTASQAGNNRVFFGASLPTAGYFAQGDIMWNSAAVAGGQAGWICVKAGKPGTWKAFGDIQP